MLGALSGTALIGLFSGCTGKGGNQAASSRVADQVESFQAIFRASGKLDHASFYDIARSNLVSGPAPISAATGGSVDIGWVASTPLIFSQAAGSPVKIIGAFDSVPAADGRSGMGVVVAANSPIRSIADLKGKRVSYALGTITQYIANQALASVGLSLKDITPILTTVERAAPLLENGHTDALVAV